MIDMVNFHPYILIQWKQKPKISKTFLKIRSSVSLFERDARKNVTANLVDPNHLVKGFIQVFY